MPFRYQSLWNSVRDELKNQLAPSTFEETFDNVKRTAKEENGLIYIICPNAVTKFKINQVYYKSIDKVLKKITTRQVKFKFVLEEEIIEKEAHAFGKWKKVSGSIWNNPIVKERTCTNCGYVERVESNSTAWVKPTVIILIIGLFVGISIARRVLNLR